MVIWGSVYVGIIISSVTQGPPCDPQMSRTCSSRTERRRLCVNAKRKKVLKLPTAFALACNAHIRVSVEKGRLDGSHWLSNLCGSSDRLLVILSITNQGFAGDNRVLMRICLGGSHSGWGELERLHETIDLSVETNSFNRHAVG